MHASRGACEYGPTARSQSGDSRDAKTRNGSRLSRRDAEQPTRFERKPPSLVIIRARSRAVLCQILNPLSVGCYLKFNGKQIHLTELTPYNLYNNHEHDILNSTSNPINLNNSSNSHNVHTRMAPLPVWVLTPERLPPMPGALRSRKQPKMRRTPGL